jgi:hypothetical protein
METFYAHICLSYSSQGNFRIEGSSFISINCSINFRVKFTLSEFINFFKPIAFSSIHVVLRSAASPADAAPAATADV